MRGMDGAEDSEYVRRRNILGYSPDSDTRGSVKGRGEKNWRKSLTKVEGGGIIYGR